MLSRVQGSVTNNTGFWIGWLDLLRPSLQSQSIMTAHNQWLSKTRAIPYCTTSVFSSAVTDLVLIYESVTCSASVVRWLTLHSWTLNFWILLRLNHWNHFRMNPLELNFRVESYVTTDGQSTSLSWNKAPIWGLRPVFLLLSVAGLLMWGALSDERMGLSFTITAGPRHRSHSRVRVPLDSLPYFLSQIQDFPFRRLLWLTGLRWRYPTPPPYGILSNQLRVLPL
jgi:hypothetical protein